MASLPRAPASWVLSASHTTVPAYTIPRHAYPGALQYLEVEFKQDLLARPEDVEACAERFAG